MALLSPPRPLILVEMLQPLGASQLAQQLLSSGMSKGDA